MADEQESRRAKANSLRQFERIMKDYAAREVEELREQLREKGMLSRTVEEVFDARIIQLGPDD